MRPRLRCLLLFAALAPLGACASAASTAPPAQPLRPAAALVSAPPASAIAVDCADDDCPSAVGVLYYGVNGEHQRCTATLIAPDRVLTAGHCLPPAHRAVGEGCGDVFVAFGGGQAAELRRCTEVLAATPTDDPGTLAPDYAIVALDRPSSRAPMSVDWAPLPPGEVVTIYATAPSERGHHSLTARRCRAEGPAAAVDALGPRAYDVGWLELCPIRSGNSGAPVVDAQGQVRGLVHGGSAPFFGRAVITPAADIMASLAPSAAP